MRYIIQSKLLKGSGDTQTVLQNGLSPYETDKLLKVSEIKTMCKEKFNNLDKFEIKEENLYFGNNLLKNDLEVISVRPGLEYNLIVK